MNRQEAAAVLAVLRTAYPAFYRDAEEAKNAVILWAEMFAEDSFAEVAAAVKTLIATKTEGFPPTIGAVKEKLSQLRTPERMTAQEGWALASKAAAGNLPWDKLPPMVQRAIGSPLILRDWGMMDAETFNSVVYSQFIKAYGAYDRREKELSLMPPDVRELVAGLADRLALGAGG